MFLLATSLLLCVVGLAAPLHGNASSTHSTVPATCTQLTYHVTLAPGARTQYTVVGWLCGQAPLSRRTIQVLLPGATMNHTYWDFPLRPQQYSYVRALTNAGYATLNLDLLGTGASAHPPADQVTNAAHAYVVHQIIQTLRGGQGPYASFGKVILVGHSYASGVAVLEASQYADVDGVILTGFLHTFAPTAAVVGQLFWPAANDPTFAHRSIPPGYVTRMPGATPAIAFYTPNMDADVMALAEASKDVIGGGIDFGKLVTTPALVQGIRVPVLSVVGQYDAFFCTPPSCPEAQAEPIFYACQSQSTGVNGVAGTVCTPRSELEVVVIPNAGHALNLQRNAQQWFAVARHWSDRHFGPCPQGCQAPS
jgi:pimeloyl-ACP methyl ester carboxylesterase